MNNRRDTHPITAPASSQPIQLRGATSLADWQLAAVERWKAGDGRGPYRGTLEIFTGGGKTLIALAAFTQISQIEPSTKLAVVVPTEALARQWIASLTQHTTVDRHDVGLLGAGSSDTLVNKRVLVAVLNSASRKLPELARSTNELMLVVDECHRAGAASFSKVLSTAARFRLGLSATPARDEVDETGLPLSFDQQIVGQKLGALVFQFGLREAREIGWLPDYRVHHHGVLLTDDERREYERISRKVTDAADRLTSGGFQTAQAWRLAPRGGEAASLAQAYIGALAARKDFLYRASERSRIAERLVASVLATGRRARMLLFHERVAEATALYDRLRTAFPGPAIELEHSELPAARRREALVRFRNGEANILVSVKSLVEGIDVPDADVGVSVASTSSVRQRIQTLGRVLRRRFDSAEKHAEMHVVYVRATVDESIYGKEDWSDLTGPDSNSYWVWPLDPDAPPQAEPGPPLQPRATEEAEWKRLGEKLPSEPLPWLGEVPDYEFSVDTRGNVTTAEGAWIDNPQDVGAMVQRIRNRPGGRFRVTPTYNLVIVYGEADGAMVPFLAGRLSEPFRIREDSDSESGAFDTEGLLPGASYGGPTDRHNGTFKIRQKHGGVIERRLGSVSQFALADDPLNPLSENARAVLRAWESLNTSGFTFYTNHLDHAWYRESGHAKFLASVPGGFLWPDASSATANE